MAEHPVAWHAWYGLQRWRKRRRAQLVRQPLCAICLRQNLVVPATVVDHVIPHRGNWNSFMTGELQSLCEDCHNSAKKLEEGRGYTCDIGVDGWPIDPKHPVYRRA
jgi:5-methylcytosine-specific restriction protein A